MEHFIYYPVTQYHITLSFILRYKNKNHLNSIILDEDCFSESFIDRVIKSKWEHVYVLKKYPRLQNFIYRNILYKFKYEEIFKISNANLVFFTFGDNFINLVVSSIDKNNHVLMGEDGIFPYYGLAIAAEYNNMLKNEPYINKLKRFVKCIINSKNQFNIQRVDKFLIFNPEWLPQELTQQYKVEKVLLGQTAIQKVFEELTCLYEYKKETIFNNIDMIYFDSDFSVIGVMTEREEYALLCGIFKQLLGKKIYIRLRPHFDESISANRMGLYHALQKETSCNFTMSSSESIYPWEIVFYNNMDDLKDVSFMSPSFSTALISSKKFFGKENNIISLRNILLKSLPISHHNESIADLIERVKKTYVFRSISTPASFDELEEIVNCLEANPTRCRATTRD